MKVAAEMVCQEEIKKFCQEGIGLWQEVRVFAGHFCKDRMGAIVAAR